MHIRSNKSKARYNKSRVERDSQTQTQEYVSRFEPLALRSRLHLEGFQLSLLRTPQRIQIQSSTQEEVQSWYTKQSPLHKEERHKAKAQSKRVITKLGDHIDHK